MNGAARRKLQHNECMPHAKGKQLASLYDGFEGYRTPEDADYRAVLSDGLVVLDANVLLNLYRYNSAARTDFVAVLTRLAQQLWIPHQVLIEFWRNREAAVNDPRNSAEETVEALEDHLEKASNVLRGWGNRVAAPRERLIQLLDALKAAFAAATAAVNESVDPRELDKRRNTNTDSILLELEPLLQGRVGQPLSPDDLASALEEGKRRSEEGIPPGFKDRGKSGDRLAGDFLVWEQVLRKASDAQRDILFVTGDVKEDWWRLERGEARGPRLELISELRSRAGVRLFMVRPETLLRHAREFLEIAVRDESVEDAERVASLFAGEWNTHALSVALELLDSRAPVQAAAIREAIERGGFVPREVVYELGGYNEERTLRGFTRPANRITQELRDRAILPSSARDILVAVYDPQVNPVQASGFRVPSELLSLDTDDKSSDVQAW